MHFSSWFAAAILFANLLFPAWSRAQITPQMIEAAKKEGEVAFYGALPINIVKPITDAFERYLSIEWIPQV
jgi:hypothetical protein